MNWSTGAASGRSSASWRGKRIFDLVVGGAVLFLAAPVLFVVSWVIRRDGGSAFYRAGRVGLDGQVFSMIKFRTMVTDADRIGPRSTADDDPRITPVGAKLRRWKLDEIPQLLNVVRGEMSLVGPRPEVPSEVEEYTPEERGVLSVRPGITDYSSIVFRNEGEILAGSPDPHATYREKIRPEKIRLALAYADDLSLVTDLRIIALTLLAVVRHESAVERVRRRFPARAAS